MKFADFIKENGVSFYKCAQLQGKNPNTNSFLIKKKILGEAPIKSSEFKELCEQLQIHLKKPVTPSMFSQEANSITL